MTAKKPRPFSRVIVDKVNDEQHEVDVYVSREVLERRGNVTLCRIFVVGDDGREERAFVSVWLRQLDNRVVLAVETPAKHSSFSRELRLVRRDFALLDRGEVIPSMVLKEARKRGIARAR